MFRPTQQNVRRNPDFAQFFDRMLRRFRLQFAGGGNIRNERNVNKNRVVAPDFIADLPNRFQKR